MVLTMHFYVFLEYLRNIMKIKNVKIQLIALASLYVANISIASAGIIDPTQVPEPSALALFAIAGAVAFIINKRKK